MKAATIKASYSLDPLTASEIEALAKAWGVAKSEVVRRSVHAAAAREDELAAHPIVTRMEALEALQAHPRLSHQEAQAWLQDIREERSAR